MQTQHFITQLGGLVLATWLCAFGLGAHAAETDVNVGSIDTNTAGSSSVTFTDGNANGGVNFYRVRRLPNP